MNEQEQQIEQSTIDTPDTVEGVLGLTALSASEEVEVTPLEDQILRSWDWWKTGL
jgi:hypothetical protein